MDASVEHRVDPRVLELLTACYAYLDAPDDGEAEAEALARAEEIIKQLDHTQLPFLEAVCRLAMHEIGED